MGKNASKNFVNQFKNTRRQVGRHPLVGKAFLEQRKLDKSSARQLKKFLPGERKNDKNSDHGDK
jgi:hypothetical protein